MKIKNTAAPKPQHRFLPKKSLLVAFACIAIAAVSYAQSGTCGDNLTWALSDNTLTINYSGTGIGKMDDYDFGSAPWHDYRRSIKTVIIGSGVTSIGAFAFYLCNMMESITIPSSVTSIGYAAFYDCNKLESITIPEKVDNIEDYAFCGCSALTSVNIPSDVTTIGDYAFYDCSALTYVTIPESVTTIGYAAFGYCNKLESITIPSSVTTIRDGAFASCAALTTIYSLNANPPRVDNNTFYKVAYPCTLYVPCGSEASYTSAWQDKGTHFTISAMPSFTWVGSYSTNWDVAANWQEDAPPTAGAGITFSENAENDLHVPTGNKTIACLTNTSAKSLVIPAGASLTVTGTVSTNDDPARILIQAANDGTPNGSFIAPNACDNNETIHATVEFYAQGKETDGIHSWQYFGIPVQSVNTLPTFEKSWIQKYDETINVTGQGTYFNKWTFVKPYEDLTAFVGYEITQDVPTTYTIAGKLNLCDTVLTLTRQAPETPSNSGNYYGLGQNIFGNSYTAAIDIGIGIEFDEDNLVEKTVYLYNTGSFAQWEGGTLNPETTPSAGSYLAIPANVSSEVWDGQIPSMQGFLLKFKTAATIYNEAPVTVMLRYGSVTANTKPQLAPRTSREPLRHLAVTLRSKSTVDCVWLFSQECATDGFDNGWDGYKFFGTPKAFIYSESPVGELQVNTSADLNGKTLTICPNEDSEYTLTLAKSNLDEYAHLHLLDLVARKAIPLTDEKTVYTFADSNAGSRVKRFVIVNSASAAFDIDNFKFLEGYLQDNNRLVVSNFTAQPGQAALYDTVGRMLASWRMQPALNNYPVALPSGVYILRLEAGGAQESIKLIIK